MFLVEKASLSSHFRSITKKSSSSSPATKSYLLASKSFDEKVILHLKTLDLVPKSSNISLSCLSKSVSFLSIIHSEAENQISNLKSDVDEFNALYMDYSLKVLDLCNLITSAVRGLTDRRLLLNYSLRLLNFTADQIPATEKLNKAKDAIARSVDKIHESDSEKSHRAKKLIEEIEVLIGRLLLLPRGKASGETDLIRRTFYAIGALTVFVGKVLVSALFGQFDLAKLRVPVEFTWSNSVNDLQTRIFDSINPKPKQNLLMEVDDVAHQAALVCDLIQAVKVNGEDKGEDKIRLVEGVKSLATAAKKYSDGIDALTNGVNGMFRTVLKTRNGRLDI